MVVVKMVNRKIVLHQNTSRRYKRLLSLIKLNNTHEIHFYTLASHAKDSPYDTTAQIQIHFLGPLERHPINTFLTYTITSYMTYMNKLVKSKYIFYLHKEKWDPRLFTKGEICT